MGDDASKAAHIKKKGIAQERKEAREEVAQVEQYERLQEELEEARIQEKLFHLFIIDNNTTKFKEQLRIMKKKHDKVQKKKAECEDEIRKERSEIGKIQREVNSV